MKLYVAAVVTYEVSSNNTISIKPFLKRRDFETFLKQTPSRSDQVVISQVFDVFLKDNIIVPAESLIDEEEEE